MGQEIGQRDLGFKKPSPVQQREVLSGTTSGLAADSCWGADPSCLGFAVFPQPFQPTLAPAPRKDSLQKGQRQLEDHERSPGLNQGRNGSWLRGPGCKACTQGTWGWLCWRSRSFWQRWKNSQSRSVEMTQKRGPWEKIHLLCSGTGDFGIQHVSSCTRSQLLQAAKHQLSNQSLLARSTYMHA